MQEETIVATELAEIPAETEIVVETELSAEQFAALKLQIEGLLFAANKPMTAKQLQGLFSEYEQPEIKPIKKALAELKDDYQDRGINLVEIASGYQFRVIPALAPYVSRLSEERAPRYSRAFLETLAIIAYRQPLTRGEIEQVRGVAVSSQILKTLQEREWIRIVGHKEVPGKPALFATTKTFLDYFNLKHLEDLPPLADLITIADNKLEEVTAAEFIPPEETAPDSLHE